MNMKYSTRALVLIFLCNNMKSTSSLLSSNHRGSSMKVKRSMPSHAAIKSHVKENNDLGRRELLEGLNKRIIAGMILFQPMNGANASNLPKDTGASLKKVGTIETLTPIVEIKSSLEAAKLVINDKKEMYKILTKKIPKEENNYKKIFDEYSTPVSYKQKFLDQNAFLVYYTRGYDGPNRPNIESEDAGITRQTLQYGARNDSWVIIDELYSELDYIMGLDKNSEINLDDLGLLINRSIAALDRYLSLVPASDLEQANESLKQL